VIVQIIKFGSTALEGNIILSRVLVTATGFGLVIGFINHSQIVITINYNTVPDLHTCNYSTTNFSVYFHLL
jgi:NhaP-type Na+/H+ and K+/H+ antiporter